VGVGFVHGQFIIVSDKGMRNMKRDTAAGTCLLIAAASGMVVMILHPTAHGLMDPESGPRLARVNAMVHGLALAVMPMIILGLIGLRRRLGCSELATAALVAYGWGCVAVMSAAVASGFVAPAVIARIVAADGSKMPDAFLLYTGLWNQAFAKVNVVATSVGILLFSAAILRTRKLAPAVGAFGLLVSVAILVLFFVGHLTLDVHGFGIVTFAQGAWLIWIGVLLLREGGATID
jgi:hypothetical protein